MKSRPEITANSSYTEICKRLSNLTTPLICDAAPNVRLMDPGITPFVEGKQAIGRVYPVNSAQDSLSTMQALDDLQAFLATLDCSQTDIVPTILTIAACGSPLALAGGMCTSVAKERGFGGVIIDGPCRDIKEIQECGLPFFAKGKCAKSGTKDKVGTIRKKITCGGVEVNPGEIIFADEDGIVVMNKQEAVAAITKGEEIQEKEDLALKKIQSGARFNQICNIDEHVANIQAGVPSMLRITL